MTQVTEKIMVAVFRCNAGHEYNSMDGNPPRMVISISQGPGMPDHQLMSNGYCPICFLDWMGKSFGLVGMGQRAAERAVPPSGLVAVTGVKPS